MAENNLNEKKIKILTKLLEYCKYLYEEEKVRTKNIENKLNIFTFFLGGGIFLILIEIPYSKLFSVIQKHQKGSTVFLLLFVSGLLFLISSICSILVTKVERFERLCNPKSRVQKVDYIHDEIELLKYLIADYVVATEKNHQINNKKAKFLTAAQLFILIGLLIFTISLFIFNVHLF